VIVVNEPVDIATAYHVQIRRDHPNYPTGAWRTYDRWATIDQAERTRAGFAAGAISVGYPVEVRVVRVTVTTVVEELMEAPQ